MGERLFLWMGYFILLWLSMVGCRGWCRWCGTKFVLCCDSFSVFLLPLQSRFLSGLEEDLFQSNVFRKCLLFAITELSSWWLGLWFISGHSLLLPVGTNHSLRGNIRRSTMRMYGITLLRAMMIVWCYRNHTGVGVRNSLYLIAEILMILKLILSEYVKISWVIKILLPGIERFFYARKMVQYIKCAGGY